MTQQVGDVMTRGAIGLPATATVAEAARAMRDADIGDVIVLDGDGILGIVTDRDIVVRVLAAGRDAGATTVAEIASRELATVGPETAVIDALRLMSERAIRRLPVLKEDGRPVGIVSIGDLAVERDRRSVLGEISAAPPNR